MNRLTPEVLKLAIEFLIRIALLSFIKNTPNEKGQTQQKLDEVSLKIEIRNCKLGELERRVTFEEKKKWLTNEQAQALRQDGVSWRSFCQERMAFFVDKASTKALNRLTNN
jgi:hypothetical protein